MGVQKSHRIFEFSYYIHKSSLVFTNYRIKFGLVLSGAESGFSSDRIITNSDIAQKYFFKQKKDINILKIYKLFKNIIKV